MVADFFADHVDAEVGFVDLDKVDKQRVFAPFAAFAFGGFVFELQWLPLEPGERGFLEGFVFA